MIGNSSPQPPEALRYRFRDQALLEVALTHRSAGPGNNERLEFLGDAILNAVIAIELFERRPDATEGELSRLRASLVRGETLAAIARELALGQHMRLGEGERKSGGHRRDSILADTLEAVIGAVYLDSDFDSVSRFVCELFSSRLAELPRVEDLKDPKTRLQEFLQRRGEPLPEYRLVDTAGADHARRFTVRCSVEAFAVDCEATATSRRKAEQQAASDCLDRLSGS